MVFRVQGLGFKVVVLGVRKDCCLGVVHVPDVHWEALAGHQIIIDFLGR